MDNDWFRKSSDLFYFRPRFQKGPVDSWTYRSKTTLLKNFKDLIDQKKASQSVIFGLLLAIALLAIFDTQILSIFRRQKEIGTYIALGMTRPSSCSSFFHN